MNKLNFSKASHFDIDEVIVFLKPLGSLLYRVCKLPAGYPPDKEKEIEQVLNTVCTKYHKGIWYFRIPDEETQREFDQIFQLMDVAHIYVRLDADPVANN